MSKKQSLLALPTQIAFRPTEFVLLRKSTSRYRQAHVAFTGRRRFVQFEFIFLLDWISNCVSGQADGIVLVKTKQAVLVCAYTAPIQAAEATPVVEALADYLIGVSY
jgi:hypothetical protein